MKSKNPYYTELRKEYPRTWRIWYVMNKRTNEGLRQSYVEIDVCDRWNILVSEEEGFINFVDDMGPCEDPLLSIDRIDTFGGYEPGNCRWADDKTQCNNTKFHTTDPRGINAKKAEANGISRSCFYLRVRRGWSIEDAYTLPPSKQKYKDRLC